jgi:S1-C subfamily serine protease
MSDSSLPERRARLRRAVSAALLAGTTLASFSAAPIVLAQPALAQQTGNEQGQSSSSNGQHNVSPIPTPGPSTNGQTPVNKNAAMPERLPDFVSLVKKVKPAVVSVTNYLKSGAQVGDEEGGPNGPGAGPQQQLPFPFNQFPFNQLPFGQMPQEHAVEARGSGFIINPDGLIVTNNHVVKDASRVVVTLADGQKLPAKVIGTDPRTDIALIKVNAGHPLPYLQLGDSRDVEPGEWVIAIGNPFGLTETVTAGIVSAVGRNIGAGPYDRFIQVDAPINQGNSGGPLITQDGKVVGMNTAILSPTGGSVGIGFAIPSDMIERIVSDLEHYGHVTRGSLGARAQQSRWRARRRGRAEHAGGPRRAPAGGRDQGRERSSDQGSLGTRHDDRQHSARTRGEARCCSRGAPGDPGRACRRVAERAASGAAEPARRAQSRGEARPGARTCLARHRLPA